MTKSKKLWLGIITFLPSVFIIFYMISFFSMFMDFDPQQLEGAEPLAVIRDFGIVFVFLILAAILGMAVMIYYIIHAAKNKAFTENNRLIWILVLIFASGVGSIVYYFVNIYSLPTDDENNVSSTFNG